jgi:hypothetical protein
LDQLTSQLESKSLVYLDVCHWINLLNVWLQNTKALPIYEKVVQQLKSLAEEGALICPLSASTLQELMKQSDPLSRAATANLIESFSRGICLRSFKDTLCEQWKVYTSRGSKPSNAYVGYVAKIGFWLPEAIMRSLFWEPSIDSIWKHVLVDLRWNVTVDDYQRLVSLGEAVTEESPPFAAKWHGLPAPQRTSKWTFAELQHACRKDVLEAYSGDLADSSPEGQAIEYMVRATDYSRVPACEIVAGMCAVQVHRGSRVRENDVLDFIHAATGIPACRAYFCNRPMEHLLRNMPLQIENYFNATIRSRPEDLLAFLGSLKKRS